jgi:hypothetical protein
MSVTYKPYLLYPELRDGTAGKSLGICEHDIREVSSLIF